MARARHVLMRVRREVKQDHLSMVAAGVAFYAFLALFPALAAVISIYGLLADPADVERQFAALAGLMPTAAREVLAQRLADLASHPTQTLGIGAVAGLLLTLWSARRGVGALVQALNIAYDQHEDRGFFRRNAVMVALTLGASLLVLVAGALVVALPAVLDWVGLSAVAATAVAVIRWPLLAAAVLFAVGVLYRVGPSRRPSRWRWVTWGSAVATALWLAASAGFSLYVSRFGSYERTYGSVAAVVVLLLWLYLSAYVVVLGAELNAEVNAEREHRAYEGLTP